MKGDKLFVHFLYIFLEAGVATEKKGNLQAVRQARIVFPVTPNKTEQIKNNQCKSVIQNNHKNIFTAVLAWFNKRKTWKNHELVSLMKNNSN